MYNFKNRISLPSMRLWKYSHVSRNVLTIRRAGEWFLKRFEVYRGKSSRWNKGRVENSNGTHVLVIVWARTISRILSATDAYTREHTRRVVLAALTPARTRMQRAIDTRAYTRVHNTYVRIFATCWSVHCMAYEYMCCVRRFVRELALYSRVFGHV